MHSTQKNITKQKPTINSNVVCKKYLRYPDESGARQIEGGLRLNGRYKQSFKEKPLITVVTVVYNNEETLERCIKSVLEQTYDNIEYIMIDGGSSDATLDIIKKYEDAIDYFISEPDKGIYYAMNKGLSLASGDYTGILNSDDLYLKNAVKVSINQIMADNSDGSVGIANMYKSNGELLWKYPNSPFDDTAYLKRNPCNHQTLFLSKEAYNIIGLFDTSLKYAADTNSEYLIIKNNLNISRIQDTIVDAYFEGGATEQNYLESEKEAYIVASRFTGLSPDEHKIIADFLFKSVKPVKTDFFDNLFKKHDFSLKQFSILFKECYQANLLGTREGTEHESILASVIIPAFNAESYISRCLDSIRNQTHKNIEIIVVNDASTDNTKNIVEEYIQKDSRITCIDQVENSGVLQARMTGIKKAKGEYIYSVDADDYVMLDLIKDTIAQALEHNADIVQFPMKFSGNDRKYNSNWTVKKYKEYTKKDFFVKNSNTWTIMFQKELGNVLYKLIGDCSVNYHDDYIISIILSAFYKKVRYIDTAYYVYCDSEISMTREYSDNALLNYIRDTLIFTRLMKNLIPIIFPKKHTYYLNIVLSDRMRLMKNQLNLYTKKQNNINMNDLYKNTDENKIFIMSSMLHDVMQMPDVKTVSRSLDHNQQDNRWYRFDQMSYKRKIWTITKVSSKKIKIYWLLQPIAEQLKKLLGK